MFFDSFSMMVLTLPFVTPLITELGFSLIWFGVVFVVLAEIGLVTPPFGLNLFVLHGVLPQYDIMKIVIGVLPFLIPMLLVIVILTAFPQLVMWLPGVLY
jgi:TRAP-type C4-dicarboxylate transport system permease large subunit